MYNLTCAIPLFQYKKKYKYTTYLSVPCMYIVCVLCNIRVDLHNTHTQAHSKGKANVTQRNTVYYFIIINWMFSFFYHIRVFHLLENFSFFFNVPPTCKDFCLFQRHSLIELIGKLKFFFFWLVRETDNYIKLFVLNCLRYKWKRSTSVTYSVIKDPKYSING